MHKLQTAALALSAAVAFPALAGLPSKDVSKILPLAAGEDVRVDTYKGSVKVTTWDRGEVAVEARIEADGECGSAERQAKWVEQTKVVIEKSHGGASIRSDYGALEESASWFGACTARPFVHYTIKTPKSASLRIKDYKSVIVVKSLEADLSVDTYKGSVDVVGLAGGLRVDTYKGEVNAEIVRLAGDVTGETYKGSIVLRLPPSAGFDLSAESGRGVLNVDFAAPETGRVGRRGLMARGAVNGGGPRVSLRTDKGNLALRKS